MKLKNKKGIVLIEAVVGIGILLGILIAITQISTLTTKMRTTSERVLSVTKQTQFLNTLEFMKKRVLASEKKFDRATSNEVLAGWVTAGITDNGSETFNTLNGTYKFGSGTECAGSYLQNMRCLIKITPNEWGSIALKYQVNKYTEDASGNEIKTNVGETDLSTPIDCSEDFSSSCLGYKLVITDLAGGRSGNYDYTLSNGTVESIRSKSVKIIINDGLKSNKNFSEYDYILSPISK